MAIAKAFKCAANHAHAIDRTTPGAPMQRLARELRGVPGLSVKLLSSDRKCIVAFRSFGRALRTQEDIAEAVSAFARLPPSSCAAKASPPRTSRCSARPIRSRSMTRLKG